MNYNFIMPDRDNTYSTNDIKKISECHASTGKNTQLAAPKLKRWKDLNNAIVDWWNNNANEETSVKISEQNNFQFYDEIQKKILSDLFKRFRELYPKKNIDLEFEYINKEAIKEINGEEYGITTHFQYEFIDGDYSEYIRLKTAFNPEPALIDRAIISRFQSEKEEYITAALSKDDLIEVDLVDNPDEIIDQHFKILEDYLNNRQKRKQGNHCNFCSMSSTCGQFPLVSEGKVNNRVRQLKVSKTNLVKLNTCERRAAWNVQYGLPREDFLEFETESDATKFHRYSQKLLVNNKENLDERNISNFNEVASGEDQVTRDKLFKKYQGLISKLQEYSNLEIKESEYQLGFTCIADGVDLKNGKAVDKKVATVFMGKADLVGRVDGVPLIIELKTRPEIPEDLLESQLYALGAAKLLKVDEVIVLHIYSLDDNTTAKERKYTESELVSIKNKFENIAVKTGSWLPFNALSPKYNIGDWCAFCEFKNTCSENRISEDQKEVISLEEIVAKEKENLQKEKNEINKEKKDLENKKRIHNTEIVNLNSQIKDVRKRTLELEKIKRKVKDDTKEEKLEKERLIKEIEKLKNQEKNTLNKLNETQQLIETLDNDLSKKMEITKNKTIRLEKEKADLEKQESNVKKQKERLFKDQKVLEQKRNLKLDEISLLETQEKEKANQLKIKEAELINIEEKISERIDKKYAIKEKKRLLKEQKDIYKESEAKKIEIEKRKKQLEEIDEDMRLKEPMLNRINNELHPILVMSHLINDVSINFLKTLFRDAGFENNEKIKILAKGRVDIQSNAFTDIRYLIKLMEYSIGNENPVPKLSHLNAVQKDFTSLRQALNYEFHNNVDANEVRVVKLGEVIIKVINSVLLTKHYSGQTEIDLIDYMKNTESLLKAFKNSLLRISKK